jgi:hypothetical protein
VKGHRKLLRRQISVIKFNNNFHAKIKGPQNNQPKRNRKNPPSPKTQNKSKVKKSKFLIKGEKQREIIIFLQFPIISVTIFSN